MKLYTSLVLFAAAVWCLSPFTVSAHPSSGIVVDAQGNVYFSDLSRGLLKVDPQGKVTTISKNGGHWLALDAGGGLSGTRLTRWHAKHKLPGVSAELILATDSPVVVTPDGSLGYVCDDEQMTPGVRQLARLAQTGTKTLVSPGLQRIADENGGIRGLAVGPDGTFFVSFPKAVLKVARDGQLTTLLNPVVAPDCEKHPPTIQDAPGLRGLVVDTHGAAYAAATGCRSVIKISPDAKVTTVLKSETPWAPCGVTLRGDTLYVLEHINPNSDVHEDWPPRVRIVAHDGKVTTLVSLAPERR